MAIVNPFTSDAFSFVSMTEAINNLPAAPTRLSQLGLFTEVPVTTVAVAIEMRNGTLTLVPAAARGAPGVNKTRQARNVRDFRTVHLPQVVHVDADEVQGIRAFGSETETETLESVRDEKLAVARQDLDITHEWQRVGALKGTMLDADGVTPLYNYLTEFNVTQQVIDMGLDSDATKIRSKTHAIARAMSSALGGLSMSGGYRVFCGSTFFDDFVDHPYVRDTYLNTPSAQGLRDDVRAGFRFGEGIWEEYSGEVGGVPYIAADEAYAVPMGVPRLLVSYFAPANYNDTVNTRGLPFYAKPKVMDFDKGLEVEVQSNPLHICTRPRAIIKLTRA